MRTASCFVLLWISARTMAGTLVVDPGGKGDFTDIQPALDAAAGGDEVVVKAGHYVVAEPLDFNKLHDPGNPQSPAVKDLVLRSESGPESTVISAAEEPADPARASVVIFRSGESGSSSIEGFTLSDGRGMTLRELGEGIRGGGGILCAGGSSPAIRNCILQRNLTDLGGGVYCIESSSPIIEGCVISENDGGGVYCVDSSPVIKGCTISANVGNSGVYATGRGANIVLSGCTIRQNSSVPVCPLEQCSADYGGGVMCDELSSFAVENCEFICNYAFRGGAVASRDEGKVTMTNCIVWGNRSLDEGGGVWAGFTVRMTNCTVTENSSLLPGPALFCPGGTSFLLTNCIVRQIDETVPCAEVSHCVMDQDPLFVKPGLLELTRVQLFAGAKMDYQVPDFILEAPDLHLEAGSPALDAGTADGAPATDLEGRARPCGSSVDIGAYEQGDCPIGVSFIRGDSNADGKVDISDAVFTLAHLFLGGTSPSCMKSADGNKDERVDLSDGVYVLNYLVLGGPTPAPPYPACGQDAAPGGPTCESHAPCG